jgi:hypothetical protein
MSSISALAMALRMRRAAGDQVAFHFGFAGEVADAA